MHRKLWARLLSCYVALTMVFAGVPVQAFAEDLEHPDQDSVEYADGALYYSNSQWSYNCLRNDGYGVEGYPTWDDFNAQTRQAILESTAWQEFILLYGGYNPMRGQWVWTRPSDAIASQMRDYLQDIVDSTAEIKPYQPGGIGGGSSSGGGDEPSGPVVSGDYIRIPLSVDETTKTYNDYYKTVGGTLYYMGPNYTPQIPRTAYLNLKADVFFNDTKFEDKTYYVYFDTRPYRGGGFDFYFCDAPIDGYQDKSHQQFTVPAGSLYAFVTSVTSNPSSNPGYPYIVVNNDVTNFYFDYKLSVSVMNPTTTYVFRQIPNFHWVGTINPRNISSGGTGGTVNPVPDPSTIEKPESPATPSNPQTPERDSPTIVIGGTTQTVPDPSPAPDLSTIEELLRRILANTNTIIEQMNSFASQLGQELADFYDAVYDWFGVIDTRLRDQIALLDSEIQWLEGIFDWTKSIDTDVQYLQSVCSNGFDNVVGVLRRILERMTLAGDSGGSKPGIVDPADPSPVMDWLRQLWTSFLADLQMVLPDQVGAVVDFLDSLRQKFPFSIPWDIAAMLALLNHAPVTPVIDIPWGYAGGIEYVHVDCHAWDDAVAIVRPMFLLLFALCLALLTRDLLAGLEAVL